jgi:hypothetical protein
LKMSTILKSLNSPKKKRKVLEQNKEKKKWVLISLLLSRVNKITDSTEVVNEDFFVHGASVYF